MDEIQDLREELFPDEPSATETADLVEALAKRLAAAERGEILIDLDELEKMRQYVALLREDQAIAGFVEESLQQAVQRRRLLDALDAEGETG